jgi:acyl carrier protein
MDEMRIAVDPERKILDFIVETYEPDQTIDGQSELVRSEIIDSYGIVELIEFLEQTFAISFPDEEIRPENFRSAADIANCVANIELGA